jgi:hypothetical protein
MTVWAGKMKDRLAADAANEVRHMRFLGSATHDHALEVLQAAGASEADIRAFEPVHAGRLYRPSAATVP